MYSEKALIRKVDLALSDLTTDGGLLNEEQAERFIRTMIEQPTILNEARVVPMRSPKMEVNKIKFGSRILRPASQDPSETVTHDGRYLKEADRAKPTTSKVLLDTVEVQAEVRLHDEVIEDNIERENFSETILTLMAEAASRDIEELIIQGDTGSGDAYLALLDGILALSTSNIVDAAGEPIDPLILSKVKKAMPKQFRAMPSLKHYVTADADVDLRTSLASRGTALGDATLTGEAPLRVLGNLVTSVHKMPDGNAFFTDPRNIVVGFHRQVRVERDRDIRSRENIIVLTARLDVKIEEEEAVVKVINASA